MSREERIFLDPSEVAVEGRTEINIHLGPIQVGEAGPDWGPYEVEQFTAKGRFGQVPVGSPDLPNDVYTIPLVIGASGDFDAARIELEAWATSVNEDGGGWIKRELIGGSYGEAGKKLFADVVKATLTFTDGTSVASHGLDSEAVLVIETLPGWYGQRVDLPAFEATGAGAGTFQIKGNMPARCEITVTDKSGNNQQGTGWAARCRNYSSASTAAWDLQAEALTPLESATEAAQTGASGNTVRHSNLPTSWTPVLSTNLKAGTYLTHEGLYDVWARVYTTSGNRPWLRMVYDVGDLLAPNENTQVQIPAANGWYLVYLGQADLRPVPYGTHRWQGVIQGRGPIGGENVDIDRLFLFCADECSGILGAPRTYDVPLTGFKARDLYLQAEGNLTGKTAEVGGKNYSAITNSDADDFTITSADKVRRVSTLDSGTISATFAGRAVGLALGLTDQMAEIDFIWSGVVIDNTSSGLKLRASGPTNYVRIFHGHIGGKSVIGVEVVRGGSIMVYGVEELPTFHSKGTLRAGVIGDEYLAFLDGERIPLITNMQTGTPIDTDALSLLPAGGVYLADVNISATATVRDYDNLKVWVPSQDAVTFASRSTKLSDLGMFRQDSTGTAYGPVARPGADLPRLPVSGPSERPVELAIKPSRGDFESLADSGLDKFSAQVSYWPHWASVPGL